MTPFSGSSFILGLASLPQGANPGIAPIGPALPLGYDLIQVARDGEEARDFLFCRGQFSGRSFEHPPRLVLLDLKLAKVDGRVVLRALKENSRTKAIPVVVLTASREEKDLVDSYRLGVNSYIEKPVEFEAFRQAIKQLGLDWLVVNEPPPPNAFRA